MSQKEILTWAQVYKLFELDSYFSSNTLILYWKLETKWVSDTDYVAEQPLFEGLAADGAGLPETASNNVFFELRNMQ